jgi:hypothetical protein
MMPMQIGPQLLHTLMRIASVSAHFDNRYLQDSCTPCVDAAWLVVLRVKRCATDTKSNSSHKVTDEKQPTPERPTRISATL